jgi:hypothetical protein
MSENSQDNKRTRNWTFIVYPESAATKWQNVLDDIHVQWVQSPLHDKDINPDSDDHEKKAHWHIMVMFDGVKSYEQIKELTDKIKATIPQKCHSAKGLVRYMIHLDNPEKYQYDRKDIIAHCGVDITELLKPSLSTRYFCIREMMYFVQEHDVIYYSDLKEYASEHRYDDWFPLLCDSASIAMTEYIKSRAYKRKMTFVNAENRSFNAAFDESNLKDLIKQLNEKYGE